jgi:branched-chain amino acid transport system ATP-binding protein
MAAGMAMNALRLEHLNKSFGSLVVTDNVNLTIAAGERHVIIGPNGAGKTSLINQIGGQLQPNSGRILLKDQDIAGSSPNRISRMGVARTFQRNNLFQNLSVTENIRLRWRCVAATLLISLSRSAETTPCLNVPRI